MACHVLTEMSPGGSLMNTTSETSMQRKCLFWGLFLICRPQCKILGYHKPETFVCFFKTIWHFFDISLPSITLSAISVVVWLLLGNFLPFRLQCCHESRRVLLIMYLLSFFIDLVPSKLQKELKLQYNSLSELLRHFWSCFPVKTQFLEEKVRLNMLIHTMPLAATFCSVNRSRW